MQVSKLGDGLAVRLPASVVEALDLKEGDDIEISVVGKAIPKSQVPKAERERSRQFAGSHGRSRKGSSSTAKRRMNVRPFFDTNILIYSFDVSDHRREMAESLLAGGGTIEKICKAAK